MDKGVRCGLMGGLRKISEVSNKCGYLFVCLVTTN